MRKSISCLLLILLMNISVFAQAAVASNTQTKLESLWLQNVEIKSQTIGTLLSELSLSYNVPIGIEIAASDTSLGNYELDFKSGTLSQLLTQFVRQHKQYSWTITDGVVNLLPAEDNRDFLLRTLLETKIKDFSIPRNTGCSTFADSLMATPELSRVMKENNSAYRGRDLTGFYIPQLGRTFTLTIFERTLQTTLNAVVRRSPTAKFWVLTRNEDGTVFLGLSARHEDMPSGQKFSAAELRH
jgi:hypothetical protein